MALTIKGIEAAKLKLDKKNGKLKIVRLSDGNGLYLEVTETSKRWRARYAFEGKEQKVPGLWQGVRKHFCSPVITRLTFREDKNRRFSISIANGMEFCVQSSFCTSDTS